MATLVRTLFLKLITVLMVICSLTGCLQVLCGFSLVPSEPAAEESNTERTQPTSTAQTTDMSHALAFATIAAGSWTVCACLLLVLVHFWGPEVEDTRLQLKLLVVGTLPGVSVCHIVFVMLTGGTDTRTAGATGSRLLIPSDLAGRISLSISMMVGAVGFLAVQLLMGVLLLFSNRSVKEGSDTSPDHTPPPENQFSIPPVCNGQMQERKPLCLSSWVYTPNPTEKRRTMETKLDQSPAQKTAVPGRAAAVAARVKMEEACSLSADDRALTSFCQVYSLPRSHSMADVTGHYSASSVFNWVLPNSCQAQPEDRCPLPAPPLPQLLEHSQQASSRCSTPDLPPPPFPDDDDDAGHDDGDESALMGTISRLSVQLQQLSSRPEYASSQQMRDMMHCLQRFELPAGEEGVDRLRTDSPASHATSSGYESLENWRRTASRPVQPPVIPSKSHCSSLSSSALDGMRAHGGFKTVVQVFNDGLRPAVISEGRGSLEGSHQKEAEPRQDRISRMNFERDNPYDCPSVSRKLNMPQLQPAHLQMTKMSLKPSQPSSSSFT